MDLFEKVLAENYAHLFEADWNDVSSGFGGKKPTDQFSQSINLLNNPSQIKVTGDAASLKKKCIANIKNYCQFLSPESKKAIINKINNPNLEPLDADSLLRGTAQVPATAGSTDLSAAANQQSGVIETGTFNSNDSYMLDKSKLAYFLMTSHWTIDEILVFLDVLKQQLEKTSRFFKVTEAVGGTDLTTEFISFLNALLVAVKAAIKDSTVISNVAKNASRMIDELKKNPVTEENKSKYEQDYMNVLQSLAKNSQSIGSNGQQLIDASKELTSEEKNEVLAKVENTLSSVPAVKSTDSGKSDTEPSSDDNPPSDPTKGYLIWPANPYLNISGITGQNIKAAEKLIADDVTPAENVYLYIPKKGADGDFCNSAIEDYLCSKLGLSSRLGVKQYKTITQIATFVQNCKGENQTKTQFTETARERMRSLLFEGDVKVLDKGSSSSSLKTNAAAQGGTKQANAGSGSNNVLTIYCTPRIGKYFEQNKSLFDKIGMSLNIKTNLFKDDTEALKEGQTIFKDILTFNNGTKSFSAGKQDTKDTMTSLSKQNASYIDDRNRLFEDDNASSVDDNAPVEKESLSKGNDASRWTWENIKANDGAKDFLKRIQTDVAEIEKGLDDGGNPSKLVGMAKAALTTWGKTWGAAVGDAADFFAEAAGLGWIMPALKASAEKYRSSEEEYDGIEAFVRSKYSKSLLNAAEDPDFYIQKGSPRK